VVGKGKNGTKDVFSVAQYFHPKTSGIMDVVGLPGSRPNMTPSRRCICRGWVIAWRRISPSIFTD
jgi:hypothetical protein